MTIKIKRLEVGDRVIVTNGSDYTYTTEGSKGKIIECDLFNGQVEVQFYYLTCNPSLLKEISTPWRFPIAIKNLMAIDDEDEHITKKQIMLDKIAGILGWDKEADNILKEIIGDQWLSIEVRPSELKMRFYLKNGQQLKRQFEYDTQCQKNNAFQNILRELVEITKYGVPEKKKDIYKIGDKFEIIGSTYILANFGTMGGHFEKVGLVNIESGNRYCDPIECKKTYELDHEQIVALVGDEKFERINK